MIRTRWTLLALAVCLSGCRREAPPPAAVAPAAPQKSEAPAAAAPEAAAATAGGEFNKFFPPAKTALFERVFTQEKAGFALAEILRDGKKVALLSVVDLTAAGEGAPGQSSRAVAGFPAYDTGSMQTSIVVGSRYKVVARSTDPSFSKSDRDKLLESVDLAGLAALAGGSR
jgi:hypothetical protein